MKYQVLFYSPNSSYLEKEGLLRRLEKLETAYEKGKETNLKRLKAKLLELKTGERND
jgi:hypothetical protein